MTTTARTATNVPSQAVQAKAATLLLTGAVSVLSASPRAMVAKVRGSKPYIVTETDGVWFCPCPARITCAHIVAVQAIR